MGKRHKANIVDVDLVLEPIQVEAGWIAQVVDTLGASIQKQTVDIRMRLHHATYWR